MRKYKGDIYSGYNPVKYIDTSGTLAPVGNSGHL